MTTLTLLDQFDSLVADVTVQRILQAALEPIRRRALELGGTCESNEPFVFRLQGANWITSMDIRLGATNESLVGGLTLRVDEDGILTIGYSLDYYVDGKADGVKLRSFPVAELRANIDASALALALDSLIFFAPGLEPKQARFSAAESWAPALLKATEPYLLAQSAGFLIAVAEAPPVNLLPVVAELFEDREVRDVLEYSLGALVPLLHTLNLMVHEFESSAIQGGWAKTAPEAVVGWRVGCFLSNQPFVKADDRNVPEFMQDAFRKKTLALRRHANLTLELTFESDRTFRLLLGLAQEKEASVLDLGLQPLGISQGIPDTATVNDLKLALARLLFHPTGEDKTLSAPQPRFFAPHQWAPAIARHVRARIPSARIT